MPRLLQEGVVNMQLNRGRTQTERETSKQANKQTTAKDANPDCSGRAWEKPRLS